MTGTAGQQRVPTNYLKSSLLPLPPLAEQQRIVTKVDELNAAEPEEEIGIAARGDAKQPYSPKLQGAINKLFKGDFHE